MTTNDIGESRSSATAVAEVGTRGASSLHHRTWVHPVPRDDCYGCYPKACVCGRYLCELAFEHHRATAGSENYWRAVTA